MFRLYHQSFPTKILLLFSSERIVGTIHQFSTSSRRNIHKFIITGIKLIVAANSFNNCKRWVQPFCYLEQSTMLS